LIRWQKWRSTWWKTWGFKSLLFLRKRFRWK